MSTAFFDDAELQLLDRNGQSVSAATALAKYKYVFVYMSAHWCPPCREFTPLLKAFYETHHEGKDFAVVFLSRDKSEEEMVDYFKNAHADYYCIPFDKAGPMAQQWKELYTIKFIPKLMLFKNASAEAPRQLVCATARRQVEADPAGERFPWEGADALAGPDD